MSESSCLIEKLNGKQLQDIFNSFMLKSEFGISDIKNENGKSIIKLNDGVRKFELHYILKNISNGGWKDNVSIKRIQIGKITDGLITTNRIRTHMLCGITKYQDKFILVVWNSYLYTNHSTNRSCYIYQETIKNCYDRGYILSHEFDQDIWLCDESHFNLLIRDYINYNYVE